LKEIYLLFLCNFTSFFTNGVNDFEMHEHRPNVSVLQSMCLIV